MTSAVQTHESEGVLHSVVINARISWILGLLRFCSGGPKNERLPRGEGTVCSTLYGIRLLWFWAVAGGYIWRHSEQEYGPGLELQGGLHSAPACTFFWPKTYVGVYTRLYRLPLCVVLSVCRRTSWICELTYICTHIYIHIHTLMHIRCFFIALFFRVFMGNNGGRRLCLYF